MFAVFYVDGGLGKVVASTAVCSAIKNKYPDRKLIVVTPWVDVFLNNPNVYRVYRAGMTQYFYDDYIKNKDTIIFKGDPYFTTEHVHQTQHIVQSWCKLFDLDYKVEYTPALHLTPAEMYNYKIKYDQIISKNNHKPILVIQTNGGSYEDAQNYQWARDMPPDIIQKLVDIFASKYTVIHITKKHVPSINNTLRLGDVSKRELFALISQSKKRVLIDSCCQHISAALRLPSTVLWVSTSPVCFGYNLHTNIRADIPDDYQNINATFFESDFTGPDSLYPFKGFEIFNEQEIVDSVNK